MPNKRQHPIPTVLVAIALSGCMIPDNSPVLASNDVTALSDEYACQTFGFRNWSLVRNTNSIELGAEASMPTPAWSVTLHHSENPEGGLVFFIETIEPAGLSNSVLTWIKFDALANTSAATQAEISVMCAGEVVWSSEE